LSKEKHTPDNAVVDLEHARVRLRSRAAKSSPQDLANDLEAVRQVAMVEYLAGAGSDKNLYASAEARSKLGLLPRCCAQPESAEQRRICAVFGL